MSTPSKSKITSFLLGILFIQFNLERKFVDFYIRTIVVTKLYPAGAYDFEQFCFEFIYQFFTRCIGGNEQMHNVARYKPHSLSHILYSTYQLAIVTFLF